MKTIKLDAKKREVTGKAVRKEAGDNIAAVMYGNGIESGSLWINANEFSNVFTQAGANTVVELVVDGAKPVNVLVYDFQTEPVSDDIVHIDFYAVNMKEEVEAEVPLVFVGIAAAIKELGGTLIKNNDSLVVRALPADLPHEIEVDLTKLSTFEDNIAVSDITVSDKVYIVLDEKAVVASAIAPRTEEEMAALDSEVDADVSGIEGVADKDVEEGEEGKEDEKDADGAESEEEKKEDK